MTGNFAISTPHKVLFGLLIGKIDVGGTNVTCWGDRSSVYRILVGMPEGKGQIGRPGLRRVDNIKNDLREV